MFSDEVADMRHKISVGITPKADSFKQQALVELSRRLELESRVKDLERDMARLVDENESLKG